MDKGKAEDIYWVLANKFEFTLNHPEHEYERLKRERVKIANKYEELKSTHSFSDSVKIAIIEWLESYEP